MSTVSTTTAVVVRHIHIGKATLTVRSGRVENLRLTRHTHIAVGVAIVGDTHNFTGTMDDVALSHCLSSHRCYFLSLYLWLERITGVWHSQVENAYNSDILKKFFRFFCNVDKLDICGRTIFFGIFFSKHAPYTNYKKSILHENEV